MPTPHDTLHIRVQYHDGLGEDEPGYPYYVAACEEFVAVTDGRTWAELIRNIYTMVAASLEGEDTLAMYNVTPNPRLLIMLELPAIYAEIA